ncbi:MAG: glutamate ligase domain-containing protein, partial [Limisphaerales bacterium]
RDAAIKKNSPLTVVNGFPEGPLDVLPLRGEHQKRNAALALAVVNFLQKQIPVSAQQIQEGLMDVRWPGRLQLVEQAGGRKLLLDGAHNIAGARAVCEALETNFSAANPALVLGILQDKDWPEICRVLAPLARVIVAVPVSNSRTADPEDLAGACRAANPSANVSVCRSLGQALEKTAAEKFIIVCGSLYLIGEALELLGKISSAKGERELNEWSGGEALKS